MCQVDIRYLATFHALISDLTSSGGMSSQNGRSLLNLPSALTLFGDANYYDLTERGCDHQVNLTTLEVGSRRVPMYRASLPEKTPGLQHEVSQRFAASECVQKSHPGFFQSVAW